jgi:hypothetical protein
MSLLLNRQAKAKTCPASGKCRWVVPIGQTGAGVLAINGTKYVVTVLRDQNRVLGYRLTKPSDMASYDVCVLGQPWKCDCPDATFHPERPGGCKHVAALRAALQVAGQQ